MRRSYNTETMTLPVDNVAISDFFALPEYSMSIPTGTTLGKRWRRAVGTSACPSGWVTGEYGDVISTSEGSRVSILWRRVVFIDAPEDASIYYHGRYRLWEGATSRMPSGETILSTTLEGLLSEQRRHTL